jgi:peptide-methionine (S)-S-oxide reductase
MSETIYLGAGCYWCVEAVYQRVVGVQGIVSGFMGGAKADPSYKEVRAAPSA